MAYRDIREFLNALDEIGELKHIKAEVDWNDEEQVSQDPKTQEICKRVFGHLMKK